MTSKVKKINLVIVYFQVYTAKSLYVENHRAGAYVEKSGENFDDAQLQVLSDENETIESEIKYNLPTTTTEAPRISSFFNLEKLNLPNDARFNFLPKRRFAESFEDENNEIEHSDVIEIEVPVIGSEFARLRKDQSDENGNNFEAFNDNSKGYADVEFLTTQTMFDIPTLKDATLTFSEDFKTSPETSHKSLIETTTRIDEKVISSKADVEKTIHDDGIQSMESKLMEQWKAADEMIDEVESEMFTMKSRHNPKFPFNVKIVVNNQDEKKSCKSKMSCSQVSFSQSPRDRDIDPEFYADYSDEDLFFMSQPERDFDRPNEMRARNARRASDDMTLFTPAPRLPPIKALKKPSFIHRLENESSLERSERVNKNIDNLMKFVSVWAQVDKFVSDRARNAIKRIAYIAGDDFEDLSLGSKKRTDSGKRMVDEPFT